MGTKRTQAALIVLGIIVVGVAVVAFYPAKAEVTGSAAADRVQSIVDLANDQPRGAADALARAAANDPAPSVRRAAVVALSAVARPADRPVIEQATHDDDPGVRRSAAKALMNVYGDAPAADRLGQMVREEPDDPARATAAACLAASDSPQALVHLVQIMDAGDPEARAVAGEALNRRYRMGMDLTANDMDWPRYIQSIKHADFVTEAFAATGTPLRVDLAIQAAIIADHAILCHVGTDPTGSPDGEGTPQP